ncbi:MAG TPA: response regulator transcription factor [Chloroflexota bacterium]|nr:response regulator transcription factor [Chloroflexota bacterium]
MKVLLADGDPDLVELLTYALRREGMGVLAAADGQAVLQGFAAERPDLLLLDGRLPGVDGFEVCRRIRRELACAVPVILLAATDREEDLVRALDVGADEYVIKPFHVRQLIARIRALLLRPHADPVGDRVA